MSKYLVKFIDSKYLPDFKNLEKSKIKLGTFIEYKEIDDKERQDRSEGQSGLNLILKKPCKKLNEFTKTNNHDYDLDSNGNFIAKYTLFVHDHQYDFNAWMFSCSFIESLNEIEELKKIFKCDSYYFITNINKFINTIQLSLSDDIKKNGFTESGQPRIDCRGDKNIYIDGWKQPVDYINESKYMNFEFNTLTEFINSKERGALDKKLWFQKRNSYSNQKEFRFIMYGSGKRENEQNIYNINDKSVILNVNLINLISKEPIYVK